MTRGLLRRGASPRIDRRAPRVRVQARARTYVHPLWHAESQLRGHRVRPPRPVSRSSAPRDVPNATTNACRSTTKQTRVASHTLPNDSRRDSRRGTRGRERSEPKRASRPIGATEIGRFVAATTTSGPSRSASVVARRSDARAQTLLGNHIKRKFATFLQRARDGRKCRLLVCSEGVFVLFEPAGGQLRRAPLCITDRTHGHSRSPWRASCRCPTGR